MPKTYDELIALAQKMQADAAKKFVEFAASKEMVQLYVDNDYFLPCMKDVAANIPDAQEIVDLVEGGKGVLQATAPTTILSE